MKKVVFLSLILVLALATTSLAGPLAVGPRLNYMGYCSQTPITTLVSADTWVCVMNPNSNPVTVKYHIYNESGAMLAEDMQLRNSGGVIAQILPRGMGWFTIGQAVRDYRAAHALSQDGLPPSKYTFIVEFIRPVGLAPWRGLVAEVKEIIYESEVDPAEGWMAPTAIKCWSETALNKGKGKYGGGVGYSN